MAKEKQGVLEKLKKRWGVDSYLQVILILVVFACTGTSVMFIKPIVYSFLGIVPEEFSWWQRVGIWLLTIFPTYQVLLLFYGTVFGQFSFFWAFEKRMFGRMFWFLSKKKDTEE